MTVEPGDVFILQTKPAYSSAPYLLVIAKRADGQCLFIWPQDGYTSGYGTTWTNHMDNSDYTYGGNVNENHE